MKKKAKKKSGPKPGRTDADRQRHALAMLKVWETRRKRMDTWISKWTKRARYYERKIALAKLDDAQREVAALAGPVRRIDFEK